MVYAIGATGLTGGAEGDLDFEFAEEVQNGYPAFVTIQDGKIYHYIADSTSGATADGLNIIKPLWKSEGVAYTGDLRWILHDVHAFEDGTNTGDIIRWNAVTEAWESSAEPFDFTQINLTPQAAAVEDTEGGVYYKSTDKSVYVCTEGS